MALSPIPNLTCGFGTSAVIVRAYKVLVSPTGLESPPVPISGATVQYGTGLLILSETYEDTTDSAGIASYCFANFRQVSVKIRKDGEDFGSGLGQWKTLSVPTRGISNISIDAKAVHREAPALPTPPKLTLPTLLPITPPQAPVPPPTPSAVCSDIATKVDSINVPDALPSVQNNPFFIYIRGIKELCSSDPNNPAFIKKLDGVKGTITLGNLSGSFDIINGVADFDASKIFDISRLVPTAASIPSLPSPQEKRTGKTYGDAVAVQIYLNTNYGTGYRAEPTTFAGGTSVKITRPNSTYFYAQTYEDIDRFR